MSTLFSFFLRLFICFLGAKLILLAVGLESRGHLVGLTILFLANVYLFQILALRDRFAGRGAGVVAPPPGEFPSAAEPRQKPPPEE